jgi:hypothetical protein
LSGEDEFVSTTHVRQQGDPTRYFAEGAAGFFTTEIALLNPSPTETVFPTLAFLSQGAEGSRASTIEVPPGRRVTYRVDPAAFEPPLGNLFSTVIDMNESPVVLVAERTMTWGNGYGSHTETAVVAPSPVWYLAEGATGGAFDLFYLLQNPHPTDTAKVRVRYLRENATPLEKVYDVGPRSRRTIWVDDEEIPNEPPKPLAAGNVSAVLEVVSSEQCPPPEICPHQIIVERAMYLNTPGQVFGAGHESAGVTAPAINWFLAEGATGSYFDLFVLLANPNPVPADVEVSYLLPTGTTYTKRHDMAPNSRATIHVDEEVIEIGGVPSKPLSNTSLSTTVKSLNGVPIIVERAMWWPGPANRWAEAHNSAGITETGVKWAVAAGENGGAAQRETYLLIANTSNTAGQLKVKLFFEGGQAPVEETFTLQPNSRFNVPIGAMEPSAGRVLFPQAIGTKFGAIVESVAAPGQTAPAQIVVERATYENAGGVTWAAGANAVATKLQ